LLVRVWLMVLFTGLVLALTLGMGDLDPAGAPGRLASASAGLAVERAFSRSGTRLGLGFAMGPFYRGCAGALWVKSEVPREEAFHLPADLRQALGRAHHHNDRVVPCHGAQHAFDFALIEL